MRLTQEQQQWLDGEAGWALQWAIELNVSLGGLWVPRRWYRLPRRILGRMDVPAASPLNV